MLTCDELLELRSQTIFVAMYISSTTRDGLYCPRCTYHRSKAGDQVDPRYAAVVAMEMDIRHA